MEDKRVNIDLTSKKLTTDVVSKEKVTSVSEKTITANSLQKEHSTAIVKPSVYINPSNIGEDSTFQTDNFQRAQDLANAVEDFRKTVSKPFSEQISQQELSSIFVDKASEETLNLTEALSCVVDFSRYFIEHPYFLEDYTQEDYVLFKNVSDTLSVILEKILSDAGVAADSVSLHSSINKSENLTQEDFVSLVVAYQRAVYDLVHSTDDFYGDANIDDDQTAAFNKVLIDLPTTLSVLSAVVSKELSSEAQISDTAENAVGKIFDSSSLATDECSSEVSLVFDGSDYFLETYAEPGYMMGGASVRDSFSVVSDKIFDESAIIVDGLVFESLQVIQDNPSTLDFSQLLFSRPLSDSSLNTDLSLLLTGKNINDSQYISESISAHIQSYFSQAFTQLSYTGTSYTL